MAQGYIRKIEIDIKKKSAKKTLLFPKNPNDEVEKMNLDDVLKSVRSERPAVFKSII